MGTPAPGKGAGADPGTDRCLTSSNLSNGNAPKNQGLHCASCGVAGALPTIVAKPKSGARLTVGTLDGRFALLCDACRARRAGRRA